MFKVGDKVRVRKSEAAELSRTTCWRDGDDACVFTVVLVGIGCVGVQRPDGSWFGIEDSPAWYATRFEPAETSTAPTPPFQVGDRVRFREGEARVIAPFYRRTGDETLAFYARNLTYRYERWFVGVQRPDGSWMGRPDDTSWSADHFELATGCVDCTTPCNNAGESAGSCPDHEERPVYDGQTCCVCGAPNTDMLFCRDGHNAYGEREKSPAYCDACWDHAGVVDVRERLFPGAWHKKHHDDWHKHEAVIAELRRLHAARAQQIPAVAVEHVDLGHVTVEQVEKAAQTAQAKFHTGYPESAAYAHAYGGYHTCCLQVGCTSPATALCDGRPACPTHKKEYDAWSAHQGHAHVEAPVGKPVRETHILNSGDVLGNPWSR